ncbi:MAG: hypothetical protein KJ023_04920, partial [Burkholderiaceae bacterium]|nr:hypothetical protein [Burkholderiaceae bacterium]
MAANQPEPNSCSDANEFADFRAHVDPECSPYVSADRLADIGANGGTHGGADWTFDSCADRDADDCAHSRPHRSPDTDADTCNAGAAPFRRDRA